MSTHLIVVDRRTDFKGTLGSLQLITTKEYITKPEMVKGRAVRVINLSRNYDYLGFGYYCSLLAEARGQKVIPTVRTILDLSQKSLYRFALPELEEGLRRRMRRLTQPPEASFSLKVFFGHTDDRRFPDFARRLFDQFRCPMLKVHLRLKEDWSISGIEAMALDDLKPDDEARFESALDAYTRSSWREPTVKSTLRYSLAILHNPKEALPPLVTQDDPEIHQNRRNDGLRCGNHRKEGLSASGRIRCAVYPRDHQS